MSITTNNLKLFSYHNGFSMLLIAIDLMIRVSCDKAANMNFKSFPPENPFTSSTGLGTTHCDTASSHTTPYSGPGAGPINYERINLFSDCPTLVQGNDGFILAYCVSIFTRNPTVYLISPVDGKELASLSLVKGALFQGVYAYVDHINRLVVTDGHNNIQWIGHYQVKNTWHLEITETISIHSVVPIDDYVVGISPDWKGNVWFASERGVVGYAKRNSNSTIIRSINLATGERIANSISTVPEGTLVATDHALYLISAKAEAIPVVNWRYAYERGPGRKPGQLSWGTGSTPAIFGPQNGTEYVTITDNAVPINLLIFQTLTGKLLCKHPIFTTSGSGSENSPIAIGNSVFVASTYGYPYPAYPPNAGNSVPSYGKFTGGLTRIDINVTKTSCNTVWTNENFRSAALPKLSIPDNMIYTLSRINLWSKSATSILDTYFFVTVDPSTGDIISGRYTGLSFLYDSLQQSGLLTKEGHYYQGLLTGVNHIWKE